MSEKELSVLKVQRSSTKGCMTRIKTLVEQRAESLTGPELECRLGILESYFKQVLSYQDAIEQLAQEDTTELRMRAELEDVYCAAKSKILSLMTGNRKPSFDATPNTRVVVTSTSANHLPKIKLPQFSGKYSEFSNFIGCFTKLIDKEESLSSLEKFNHLVACLSGSALRTIKAYEISDENYSKALNHLKSRYDNKYLIFQEHIVSLFNLARVTKNSASQLRDLIDATNAHMSALQSLGTYEDIANAFVMYLVNSKLDSDSQSIWEAQMEFSKLPSWIQASEILAKRCQYLESRDAKALKPDGTSGAQTSINPKSKGPKYGSNATALAATHNPCAFCGQGGHLIYKCQSFLNLPVVERFNQIKERALCINCLFKGHTVRKCSVKRCRVCSLPHHTLLHKFAKDSESNQSASVYSKTVSPTSNTSLQTSHVPVDFSSNHVFLATALVKVKDRVGSFYSARVLLDSASQLNFITEDFAQLLKLKKDRVETSISGIGHTASKVKFFTQAMIKSRVNEFETSLQMYVLPNITGLQPERAISIENWDIPSNLQLADPYFFKPQKVDMLIGADLFFSLLCVGQIKLSEELPILQKTLFGWIVAGRYTDQPSTSRQYCSLVCDEEAQATQDGALVKLVEDFWREETIDTAAPKWNEEQTACEESFKQTFRRVENGRFIVKLPFKLDPRDHLGNSLDIAKRRFSSLERRLSRNEELKRQYTAFLQEYLAADHMEKVSMADIPAMHYFLPHHCVIRPESSSTKLRVVFDASCRTSSHKSLNDLLMVVRLFKKTFFLRFRWHRYAITADISAMYRQILVFPEDRNFQLILWRENQSDELQVYRLKTVTYGTAAAPFLATRCLRQLAEEFKNTMPESSQIVQRDFYMDDLISGADTREDIFRIREDVDSILSSAKLQLRKWYSNDEEFLQNVPNSDREKLLRINDIDIIKTLGLVWEPIGDEFHFQYKPVNSDLQRVTKRTVLASIARLFDPLGLINPIVVKAKIFLQELWILKLDWDETIPMELEHRWREFIRTLPHVQNIRIPRFVMSRHPSLRTEIHGFSDASQRAFGCCLYLRCVANNGDISVNLLAAKSKVAPIRTSRSLPCLELCAALLLAKLLDKVLSSITKPYDQIFLWTDSEIVLDWLLCHPGTLKPFVANRVSEIQGRTLKATWRHVSTKFNPADIISRGSTVEDLLQSMWYSGPEFLYKTEEHWPVTKPRHISENLPERRNTRSILTCTLSETFLEDIYSCSSFVKICRRYAWILRFSKNVKARLDQKMSGELLASEIDDAFIRIVWRIQQKEFAADIAALEDKGTVNLKSLLCKLNPFVDEICGVHVIRVGGRLKHSDLPYDGKFPILLPRDNPFVLCYVRFLHQKKFHAGPLALVSILRQRFWAINARDYARKVTRSCIHCFKYKPKLEHQIMGDLPKGRVNASLPFTHCGVDFCGPFTTTYGLRGKKTYKSYVCIFICFATKAVHIEVVSDLTSDAFIAALKRFIGRRNLCRHIYCDNATNFVGARRQLEELRLAFLEQQYQKDISKWCSSEGINFHPIPPRAPHFGGLWEAAVKSAKTHLYRTLQGVILTFEELSTVMVQIEGVLNSRPITPLSPDPNEEEALTPAHFLNQAPLDCFVEPEVPNQNGSYLRRWQRLSALVQHFWKRWAKEYLSTLQERLKWQSPTNNLLVGTLVLIHQDDLPPYKWKLGRIVDATLGQDGRTRVVNIQTSGTVIQRPIHKVAALPVEIH